MINGGYLIPANTKKGQLIFSIFTPPDLILFASGVGVSILLLIIMGVQNTINAIVSLLPVLICGFLVLPLPNYRNVKTFIKSTIEFFTNQRIYKWRGWCINGQSIKEENNRSMDANKKHN